MRFNLKLICLAFIAISVASCKKDGSSTTPTKMSAVIDGKAWDSSVRISTLQNSIFVITGTSLTGEVIAVTINGETTGTYNLALLPPSSGCAATYKASVTASSSDIFASVTGTVVLTKVDKVAKLISGTFTFSLMNTTTLATKNITQGQFNDLAYQ